MHKILVLKNISREGPGLFDQVANDRNIDIEVIDLDSFNHAESLPPVENYSALIVCGGPDSANDKTEKMLNEITYVQKALSIGIPYFGICLGMQVLGKAAGGYIGQSPLKEIGFRDPQDQQFVIELNEKGQVDPLFKNMSKTVDVFQLHGEAVEPGIGIEVLGVGKWCPTQVIKVGSNAYGIQSHIELNENMFEEWLAQDDDLKNSDQDQLRSDYKKIRDKYESIGKQICNNFFDLINAK